MRLTEFEITAIKETVKQYDKSAKVYLFGSRVDDSKKGGDIDLFIETDKLTLADSIKLKIDLYNKIGEQKIDIVLPNKSNQAFIKIIKQEGAVVL